MPWAVCGSCGKETSWRNRRGTKLAEIPCPACGRTDLHPRLSTRPTVDRRPIRCALCGRTRHSPRMVKRPIARWGPGICWCDVPVPDGPTFILPADAAVCWHHDIRCPDSAIGPVLVEACRRSRVPEPEQQEFNDLSVWALRVAAGVGSSDVADELKAVLFQGRQGQAFLEGLQRAGETLQRLRAA